jgi:hypothetical protein
MKGIFSRGFQQGLNTVWTLGKVIFPVTIIVTILQYTPVLPWIIDVVEPLMRLFGLSGEAAVPLVLGNALNVYAGIGAILSFEFTVKEVFIMAMMLSFSHNLFIESAVASRVGVSWLLLVGVRLALAGLSGIINNLVWQGGSEVAQYGMAATESATPNGMIEIGFVAMQTAIIAILQLALIVIPLMIGMQFLREKGWMEWFSSKFAPFLNVLGMHRNTSMTMVTGLTIGLAFGAGMMIQAKKEDGVSNKDMHLALIFLVACHAVVEDTLIFLPLGIPVWPLLVIRLGTAILLTITIAFFWNQWELRKERKHEHSYDTI